MSMQISWSKLLGYGIVFWIFLCITDLFGPPPSLDNVITIKEFEDLCKKPNAYNQPSDELFSASKLFTVLGNSLVVLLTVILCTIFIITTRIAWKVFSKNGSKEICSKICSLNQYPEDLTSSTLLSSNENVDIQKSGDKLLKRCGSNLDVAAKTSRTSLSTMDQSPIKNADVQRSCPDLSKRSSSNNNLETIQLPAKTCRSLHRTNLSTPNNEDLRTTEEQLNIECETLKDEIHRVQNFSIKEHSYLTRNLVEALKENKALTKQIVVLTNENTIFKKQIRYLFQQREMLMQELELAKIQFQSLLERSEAAEAKLMQFSDDVENLKKNLVQAFENHKVLEYNLLVSDVAVIKLNSRVTKLLIRWQQPSELDYKTQHLFDIDDKNDNHFVKKNMESKRNLYPRTLANPNGLSGSETDIIKIKEKLKELEDHFESVSSTSDDDDISNHNPLDRPEVTFSETAIDSRNTNEIQGKLNKLEINAQNLISDKYDQNSTKTSDDHDNTTYATLESEITLPSDSPNDPKYDSEWETQCSESSPRPIYWCDKFVKVIRKKVIEPSNVIQDPIRIHLAKCKQLNNMRNRSASPEKSKIIQEPKRLVSSSVAFNNFMKNLNKFNAPKKNNVSVNQGIYF